MKVHVIMGGPGCNKTGVLIQKYAEMVNKYGWDKVAFISYTVAQVRRDKKHAKSKTKLTQDKMEAFRTIHSTARKHYKYETVVMPEKEYDGMSVFLDTDMQHVYRGMDYMRQLETDNMAVGANVAGMETDSFKKYVYFYNKVKERKSTDKVKVIDFSDMLKDAVDSHYKVDVKVCFVDECQDLTPLQWRAVYTFFRDVDHLYAAGDPNQSIYRFGGGSANYMLDMRYDDLQILNHSTRCCSDVMEMAFLIWKQMKHSAPMPISNGNQDGFGVFYPERKLKQNVKDAVNRALKKGDKVMVLALTYFQLLKIRDDILNDDIEVPHHFFSGRCKYHYKEDDRNVITFSTVHQAKGSEADYVIFDTSFGHTYQSSGYGSIEEQWQDYYRLIYTGITRAKKGVILVETSPSLNNEPNCKQLLYYSHFGLENYRTWINGYTQSTSFSPSNMPRFDLLQPCATK